MPGSIVAYYQQVGRAGRALRSAYGVLLSGQEESDITDWFISSAFPTRNEAETVLQTLEEHADGLSINELLPHVNISQERIKHTMQLLSLESPPPLVKQGSKWQLTAAALSEDFWARTERLTQLRRDEQQQMKHFVGLPFGQHMHFMINELDGDTGSIEPPSLPELSTVFDDDLAKAAVEFLRRTNLPIEPRKRWPAGGLPKYNVKGTDCA